MRLPDTPLTSDDVAWCSLVGYLHEEEKEEEARTKQMQITLRASISQGGSFV